jgi:hypothetical protein
MMCACGADDDDGYSFRQMFKELRFQMIDDMLKAASTLRSDHADSNPNRAEVSGAQLASGSILWIFARARGHLRYPASSVKRQIRRAERLKVRCTSGIGSTAHGLLPAAPGYPPQTWTATEAGRMVSQFAQVFWKTTQNLAGFPRLAVRAAVLTLNHNQTLVYKYPASNGTFHHLPGTTPLLWDISQTATADRCADLDLGRCDSNDVRTGLINGMWSY